MKVYVDTSTREEIGYGGGWLHTNVWAAGKLIATFDNHGGDNGLHFHLDDPLGTRRAQTDGFGTLEAQYASLPYGDGLETATGDPTENHFTGKERDAESGNDYFGARYYNSATGRFLSPDKPFVDQLAANPQSWNLYGYARNNPLKNIDVGGNCSAPAVGEGQVGICVEAYIQAKRFGFLDLGKGDNRGPVANDPSATFRTQTLINVDIGSGGVSETSSAGLSDATIGAWPGVVHDSISGLSHDKNGTAFTLTVYGENGAEAKHVPGAPGGWIEMQFGFLISPDGKVHITSNKTKKFPSVSVYSYSSSGAIQDLWQQQESGNINDLNQPWSSGNGSGSGTQSDSGEASRQCQLGNRRRVTERRRFVR